MSTMLRNQFSNFFFSRLPFIDHIMRETYGMYPEQFSKFFRVKKSGRAFENVLSMISLGYLAEKGEDEAVTYDSFKQGPYSKFIHTTHALAVRTSMEAMQDDGDGILKGGAQALARSARYTPEIVAANIINNGESAPSDANKFVAPRSEALFSATHSTPFSESAATYSNLGSADFSITALRAALSNMQRITDERGKLVRFTPDVVFGSPEMQYIFQEILNSDGKAGTADNDLNAFRVLFNLSPVQWHYLTDLDAWYLRAKPNEHGLVFYWRMPFATDHDMDFDTGGSKSKIVGRFSAGYESWRGLYASTP